MQIEVVLRMLKISVQSSLGRPRAHRETAHEISVAYHVLFQNNQASMVRSLNPKTPNPKA